MIVATQNGAEQEFTEAAWSLMPKHKYGWTEKKAAPKEVEHLGKKGEKKAAPGGDNQNSDAQ